MCSDKARLTIDELYETLKRTSLPTVLVEGKDDIIFYRKVEESLRELGVDMLPAGNKGTALELYRKLMEHPVSAPIVFVVDNDLWVHSTPDEMKGLKNVIMTDGYSIENDLFSDGDLESLLDANELPRFRANLERFISWYALAVNRHLEGKASPFRTHPNKLLDDGAFYEAEITLEQGETYPNQLYNQILSSYGRLLRGKSLFALLVRELSSQTRNVKFSVKQLMVFGASRKGPNFQRIRTAIRESLERATVLQ